MNGSPEVDRSRWRGGPLIPALILVACLLVVLLTPGDPFYKTFGAGLSGCAIVWVVLECRRGRPYRPLRLGSRRS